MKIEQFECNWCGQWFDHLELWHDECDDIGWCSQKCVDAAEAFGLSMQNEDENE